MAPAGRLCCAALLCGALSLCSLRAAPRQPDTLYLWIDAQQARVLIGKCGRCPRAAGGSPEPSPARRGCRTSRPFAFRRLRGGYSDRVRGEDGPVHPRLQESPAEDARHPGRHPRHELHLAGNGTGRCRDGAAARCGRGSVNPGRWFGLGIVEETLSEACWGRWGAGVRGVSEGGELGEQRETR